MDTIGTLLREKGNSVHSVAVGSTVYQAVTHMCNQRVGAVLVLDAGKPVGIFTERDLMTRVILERRESTATRVEEVMTRDLVCVDLQTELSEAMAVMTQRRCRHLPVVSEGRLVGLVSIGDIVRWMSHNQEFEIRMLQDYITGKYPV